jgi:hypothetical protein
MRISIFPVGWLALCLPFVPAAHAATADIPGATIVPSPAVSDAPYKLSVGAYPVSGGGGQSGGSGLDVNMRYSYGDDHVWVGYFRSPALGFSQPRAGWDGVYNVGALRVLPSLQMASGGFFGGSIAVETGTTWFGGGGLGRTNLRNYANLNFDPNDSITVYGGYRWDDADSMVLQLVRDNRLNPDQQNLHFIWRDQLEGGERFTLDALVKQGTVEDRFIRRMGLSFNYEWSRWFAKLAWDPKVNFTAQNMVRLSTGVRF